MRRSGRAPPIHENSTTQPACRQTSAVAEATEVSFSEVTHSPKWAASATAATAISRTSRPLMPRTA